MADSENSRSLSSITRRKLLCTATASLTASFSPRCYGSSTTGDTAANTEDLAVSAWEQWNVAHQHRTELCRLQVSLETTLKRVFRGQATGQKDRQKSRLNQEFLYHRTIQAETKAIEVEEAFARTLWETPASSIDGAIGKLQSLIETEDPGEALKETPWPELRSVLADLIVVAGNTTMRGIRSVQDFYPSSTDRGQKRTMEQRTSFAIGCRKSSDTTTIEPA